MDAHPANPAVDAPPRGPSVSAEAPAAARGDASPGVVGAPPGPPVELPYDLDLDALERRAREVVGEMAYAYFAGAAEDERLLRENPAAWSHWRLRPRVLKDVSSISTATCVAGVPMASPLLVAPTAIQRLAHPDGEAATAVGAARAGVAMVLSSISNCRLEDVAAAAPGATRFMQVYVLRDRARTAEMVRRAVEAGYRALVLTVDAPVSGLRRRELRQGVHLPDDLELPNLSDPTTTAAARQGGFMRIVTSELDPGLTYDDLGWLHELSGLPVLVKGVLRGDDARHCMDAGAAGVIVSNHGARQLDDAPPTADVLAEVTDAVEGRGDVLVDGGIRRGPDIVKALCLGASGVLVGRPVIWSLAAEGPSGVSHLLGWLLTELRRTMALCGAADLSGLDRSLVARAPR